MFDPWILSRALVSNSEKMLDGRPRDFISTIVLSVTLHSMFGILGLVIKLLISAHGILSW